ncbi:lachesin-like isoform X2 [Nylanderia fulva]|uniref:lachesin-like isoform X2 n=1 Tax=Nylanderia fulva TaxID=613905 RepID=UPI0010FB5024|nr:lachesin-like isoform X2 [Nylanderia fulva]
MAYGLPYGMASQNIALCVFIAAFLHVSLGQTPPKSEVLPEFLALLENHTVTQGRDVSFTCVVNHLQSYKREAASDATNVKMFSLDLHSETMQIKRNHRVFDVFSKDKKTRECVSSRQRGIVEHRVAWIKSDSRAILAIHTHMVAHNPRLSVTHNGHNTWKLHVTNVQPNDSGTYMCQVNTDPMRSQTGHMKVVIPPDIMDLDDTADSLTTKENGDLQLRCRATGNPEPVVIWRREDGRNITLRNEHQGVKLLTRTYEGEQLHLRNIQRQEMGSYLCIASNGVPPSVSKRYYVNVRFKPLIKVTNQLVAAPVDSDVLLQCYVESSPKALNTWYRNNGTDKVFSTELFPKTTLGVKLLEDEKHDISEVTINDYAYQLNLTVRRLDRSDFGTYTCCAENAFGKAEASIRLQELQMPKPTITSPRNTEVFEKHVLRKQAKKKYESDLTPKNVGHTTPISRRNSSSSSPNIVNKSRNSAFPASAPALAPAHSAPTQLGAQNGVRSSRDARLCHIGLTVVVLLILNCD